MIDGKLQRNITVTVNDWPITMEVAALSLLSESTLRKLWPGKKLLTSTVRLYAHSYTVSKFLWLGDWMWE